MFVKVVFWTAFVYLNIILFFCVTVCNDAIVCNGVLSSQSPSDRGVESKTLGLITAVLTFGVLFHSSRLHCVHGAQSSSSLKPVGVGDASGFISRVVSQRIGGVVRPVMFICGRVRVQTLQLNLPHRVWRVFLSCAIFCGEQGHVEQ